MEKTVLNNLAASLHGVAVRWETVVHVWPCLAKQVCDSEFAGFFVGLAATGDVDLEGDRFSEEVFKTNVDKLVGKPVLLHHGFDKNLGATAVGKVVETRYVDGEGLWVKAGIFKTFENVWRLVKNGFLKALSIGGLVKRLRFVDGVREIEEAEITEVSLTSRAANPRAKVVAVFGKALEHENPKALVSGNEAVAKGEQGFLDTPYFRRLWSRRGSQRIKQDIIGGGRDEL